MNKICIWAFVVGIADLVDCVEYLLRRQVSVRHERVNVHVARLCVRRAEYRNVNNALVRTPRPVLVCSRWACYAETFRSYLYAFAEIFVGLCVAPAVGLREVLNCHLERERIDQLSDLPYHIAITLCS